MDADPTKIRDDLSIDQVRIMRLENSFLRVDVCPTAGGRVISMINKTTGTSPTGFEFLWRNEHIPLRLESTGAAFDPNFYGGIDEVIPGDLPERIGALDCPDHGELWTLPLEARLEDEALVLHGLLPRWGLHYHKRITLRPGAPWVDLDYCIQNCSSERRVFLWKLHAAVSISAGDHIICPAQWAAAADPQWSSRDTTAPFAWSPEGDNYAYRIPAPDGTTEFLFLYDLRSGSITLRRPALNCEFSIVFDPQVFPYVCYFASYGRFDGHYTAVLEPCTAMPLLVNQAARLNQCSRLEPGEQLTTKVSLFAGQTRLRESQ